MALPRARVWDIRSKRYLDVDVILTATADGEILHGSAAKVELSTGKKDKDGKEIFDNDILQGSYTEHTRGGMTSTGRRMVVKWDDYNAWWEPINLSNGNYEKRELTDYKVIGNMNENPELMEEGLWTK